MLLFIYLCFIFDGIYGYDFMTLNFLSEMSNLF